MGRISQRFVLMLLGLFLLAYVGYQGYRYYFSPVRVATVFPFEVYRSLHVSGAVLRSEAVMYYPQSGVRSYALEDGQWVSVGQTIVEFYETELLDHQIRRMREITREIEMLTAAQNPSMSNFANAESIGRDIRGHLGQVTQMSSSGQFSGLENMRDQMTLLLSRRQVAIGREMDFFYRIEELRAEMDDIGLTSASASPNSVTAQIPGYFVREADGFEDILVPNREFFSLNVAGYRDVIETASRSLGGVDDASKIVTNHDWFFVSLVPKFDIQNLRVGDRVGVDFETVDGVIPGTVHRIVSENAEDYAALIIRCNDINGDILRLRNPDATIMLDRFSGLRINTSDLRVVDGVRGVFVLSNRTVVFRRIHPIYEESAFILSRPFEDLTSEQQRAEWEEEFSLVRRFDQVIVRGMDLYHGRSVS